MIPKINPKRKYYFKDQLFNIEDTTDAITIYIFSNTRNKTITTLVDHDTSHWGWWGLYSTDEISGDKSCKLKALKEHQKEITYGEINEVDLLEDINNIIALPLSTSLLKPFIEFLKTLLLKRKDSGALDPQLFTYIESQSKQFINHYMRRYGISLAHVHSSIDFDNDFIVKQNISINDRSTIQELNKYTMVAIDRVGEHISSDNILSRKRIKSFNKVYMNQMINAVQKYADPKSELGRVLLGRAVCEYLIGNYEEYISKLKKVPSITISEVNDEIMNRLRDNMYTIINYVDILVDNIILEYGLSQISDLLKEPVL